MRQKNKRKCSDALKIGCYVAIAYGSLVVGGIAWCLKYSKRGESIESIESIADITQVANSVKEVFRDESMEFSTKTTTVHEHLRKLRANQCISAKKIAEALSRSMELPDNHTWVKEHPRRLVA